MDEGGRWLPVDEAAKLLGISPDAVRKRIKRGRLEARPGNDGLLRVLIPSDALSDKDGTPSDITGHVQDILGHARDAELEQLRAAVLALTERAAGAEGKLMKAEEVTATLRELVDELKAQLARERGRRREIEARLARPWWRRWLG
jgi:excisionase family DNA binding protein